MEGMRRSHHITTRLFAEHRASTPATTPPSSIQAGRHQAQWEGKHAEAHQQDTHRIELVAMHPRRGNSTILTQPLLLRRRHEVGRIIVLHCLGISINTSRRHLRSARRSTTRKHMDGNRPPTPHRHTVAQAVPTAARRPTNRTIPLLINPQPHNNRHTWRTRSISKPRRTIRCRQTLQRSRRRLCRLVQARHPI